MIWWQDFPIKKRVVYLKKKNPPNFALVHIKIRPRSRGLAINVLRIRHRYI